MTAIFNFQSLLLVILLIICTSTYVHSMAPGVMDRNKDGVMGIFWKCARIGERLSPYVSIFCIVMAVSIVGCLFFSLSYSGMMSLLSLCLTMRRQCSVMMGY
ncbi:hypothetical protein CLAIMM_10528 [Cladophialophora immunda]|nr:hypothetical protein CLAIMM_10528 [Cladophialophora immunda]